MKQKSTYIAAIIAAGFNSINTASADVITDWNEITLQATKTAGLNSNLGSRIDAIQAIAVYDAVNSAKPFGTPYHYFQSSSRPASPEAAAAQAAHDVLLNYFPNQQLNLDAALANSLSKIPAGSKKTNGLAIGVAAAADIVALRAADGSTPDAGYPGPINPGPGQWRPTPPAFGLGINEQWGSLTPFVLDSPSQFRPPPPPAIDTWKYNLALKEVQTIGSIFSSVRPTDETHIAQFYKQDAELTVNEAARILATRQGLSVQESALLFALTDIAVADVRIAVWDAKYTYLFWRPVTALNANPDGNVTNGYATWTPLIVTPPHPDYPSGHSATVDAGFTVLRVFFGDDTSLTLHTTTPGEPPRSIDSLKQGERENGLSRIYGGIHFSFDNEEGQRLGQKVAAYVLRHGPRALEHEHGETQHKNENR